MVKILARKIVLRRVATANAKELKTLFLARLIVVTAGTDIAALVRISMRIIKHAPRIVVLLPITVISMASVMSLGLKIRKINVWSAIQL
jgi:hypothetical protein